MNSSITVTLPTDVKAALENIASQIGMPTEEVVGQAVKEHLFFRDRKSTRLNSSHRT